MMFHSNALHKFSRDECGVVGVTLAILAVPVLSSFAMVGSISQQNLEWANINKWAQEACQRINSSYYDNLPVSKKVDGANKVLESRANGNARYSYETSESDGIITVSIKDQGGVVASALNSPTSASLECNQTSYTRSSENQGEEIVFFENFEAIRILETPDHRITAFTSYPYYVYPDYPSWTLSYGPGVELQYVTETENQVAELDSTGNQNIGSACHKCKPHTEISREVELLPGVYRLSFQYTANHNRRPEGRETTPSDSDRVDYSLYKRFAGSGTPPVNYREFEAQAQDDPKNPGWREIERTFTISSTGAYQIYFKAGGEEDGLGGLIDDIKLVRLDQGEHQGRF